VIPAPPELQRLLGPDPSVKELRLVVRARADGTADVGAAVDGAVCADMPALVGALRMALPPLLEVAANLGLDAAELLPGDADGAELDGPSPPPPAAPPPVWIAFARDDLYRVERRIVGRLPCAVTLRPDTVVVVAPPEAAPMVRGALLEAGVGERPVCGGCGCTEDQACATPEGPCAWATRGRDLCTACAAKGGG